jgi:hypothetical protein
MFSAAANPYDEIISECWIRHMIIELLRSGRAVSLSPSFRADSTAKATDENLASEDWALNLEVCDKVSGEGQTG